MQKEIHYVNDTVYKLCMHVYLLQSCPTLCNPVDCSPQGSSAHGILQAGILEWAAIPSSRGSPKSVVVQSPSCVQLFMTPWSSACRVPLSSTISKSLLKFMSVELVMLSNHLVLCCPLLPLPSIFPCIRVFSNDLALHIR